MIRWLLVDIGDVLLLKNTDVSFVELLAKELALEPELAQKINAAHYTTMETKNIPEVEFVASLKENLGYDAPKDIYAYFARAYSARIRPNTQLLRLLDDLRATGMKTAVLSNTIDIYREIQERAGIGRNDGFDPVIYSWRVGLRKPDPRIFELALKELGATPEQVIFIDDKAEHIRAAGLIGMKTILFKDNETAISQIERFLSRRG